MAAFTVERPVRVVVLGWGNSERGDDGLGLSLIDRLQARPELRLIGAHQLQIEHVLDLQGCDLAIFADAAIGLPAPYTFRPVRPASPRLWSSHAFGPAELLAVYRSSLHQPPPRGCFLEIAGTDFELGHGLSTAGEAHLNRAVAFMERLLGLRGQRRRLVAC
jgi:hydrogenase maturation protease